MVSRARGNRRELPRDEHVTRGYESAQNARHAPWRYKMNVKSGTSRTKVIETEGVNRLDVFARMITEHAEEGKDLFVWNMQRSLRYQAKVRDY